MAPEQWVDADYVDHRADIYAIGIVLYELATGERPFPDHSDLAGYEQDHLHETPPDPRSLKEDVPASLSRLILECLSKDPEKRPASFEVLGERLARAHSPLH